MRVNDSIHDFLSDGILHVRLGRAWQVVNTNIYYEIPSSSPMAMMYKTDKYSLELGFFSFGLRHYRCYEGVHPNFPFDTIKIRHGPSTVRLLNEWVFCPSHAAQNVKHMFD